MLTPLEWAAVIEAFIIWWGTMQYGEATTERDQYKAITEQCAESRQDQRAKQWGAYDVRQKRERDTGEIMEGSKLNAGEIDNLVGDTRCPGLGAAFRGLAGRQAQRVDKLNDLRLRANPRPDE